MRAAFLIFAAALACAAPAYAELDLNRAEVSHLPNGLTVIMLEDHSFPVVSIQMLYKSGSAAETTGKTGLAHFMEHLAFRGSKNFPNERATELTYDAGGEWHGYTAYDQTTYFATMPRDDLDLLLRIEADRMARTLIDPASIEAERGAVITEMHSYENDPALVLEDAVTRTALQEHPYGNPMVGYVSDVEHLSADDARAYYASHYAPANAVLAIVGDVMPSQAHMLLAKDFADVPARPVLQPSFTAELPQRGQRKIELSGAVDRQYFLLAFPAPAASNADFPAFLVLQELLSGSPGLNPQQSHWSPTPSAKGSLLIGAAGDIATFLPPTHDPFLFTISGSIPQGTDRNLLEHDLEKRILSVSAATKPRVNQAKSAVIRAIADNVETTQEAAHQLAFFEGIGAFDTLLRMPQLIREVTPADVQRVARAYLRLDRSTLGWMVPGTLPASRAGAANPQEAADRPGAPPVGSAAGGPELRHLRSGLPAIVQVNPLSDRVTVELLLNGPVESGTHPTELPGLDAVVRTGAPEDLASIVSQAVAAGRQPHAHHDQASEDPEKRLQQLLLEQIGPHATNRPEPLAIIVSGKIEPDRAFRILERELGGIRPGKLTSERPSAAPPSSLRLIHERIAKPLSQGALGYVVEGPSSGSHDALAWQLLLYVLTHDYSGRLGRSAITDKGLVYHIYSGIRTDGRRTWATIWTGVDPAKADSMEAELREQLARLATDPPSATELDAARNHLLGRDLTAAQSNDELATKLAREFVESGGIRSHDQLREDLQNITTLDLDDAARSFVNGTIIRVDVLGTRP